MEDDKKIKFKAHSRGGFDLSFNNLEMLSSVKMVINKVTAVIYKEKFISYIGLRERMDNGDVIAVGHYKVLYKIISHKAVTTKKGNIYRIKRVDGSNITQFDIDAVEVGQKVLVTNRKTFRQIFDDFLIFDENE